MVTAPYLGVVDNIIDQYINSKMYEEHPIFIDSNLSDNFLWKYMDLWKFLDLIKTSSLFFSKVTLMGDQNEGKVPKEVIDFISKERLNSKVILPRNVAEYLSEAEYNYTKERALISCWTFGKSESFAFWKMYAKDKLGVAIKTRLTNLKDSFRQIEQPVCIGQVNYFDPEKLNYDRTNGFFPFLNKHRYYEYEREVRCIVSMDSPHKEDFLKAPIDLNSLIQELYISPFAVDIGFKDLLELLRDKNNLKFDIKLSEINDKWL